jgi:hypothetical protein
LDPRGIGMESGEGFTMRNFIVCTVHLIVRVIKSIRLRWAVHIAKLEVSRIVLKILTGKPAGKRLLGRPRRRWEDNTTMALKEISIIRGIGLIQLRIGIIGEPLRMRY